VNGLVSSTIIPLQAKFVIESFALENETEFSTEPLPAFRQSGANKLVLLFHLSEKKKRHNPTNGHAICIRKAALHQSDQFGSLTEARQKFAVEIFKEIS
jgi:hypothetical protein